jgi:hypothetical protein
MRSNLPSSVIKLVEFITNQQILAINNLGIRSVMYGTPITDRDSVIFAIYIDICTDAVWLKDLSKEEAEELVCLMFIDDFSKSNEKRILPLTLKHCNMAHNLRMAQDENWRVVADLAIESLRGGALAPTLSEIIEDLSITWDLNRLNRLATPPI